MIMNQTQHILLSQPYLKGKHTLCAQIALRSFGANRVFQDRTCSRRNYFVDDKYRHQKKPSQFKINPHAKI